MKPQSVLLTAYLPFLLSWFDSGPGVTLFLN